jgi:hypothetical protein
VDDTVRKATIIWIAAIALVLSTAVAGWSVTRPLGVQITACGFDAKGAYANVRVNNLLGFSAHRQRVLVGFSVKGSSWRGTGTFQQGRTQVTVPAHGRGTAFVQGHFPGHGSFLGGTHADFQVKGRTVYRWGDGLSGRYVSKKFVLTHPKPLYQNHIYIETVPDDLTSLRCEVLPVPDYEDD